MVPELSRLVRRATFCLVALGAGATEIAAIDGRSVYLSLAIAAAWLGVGLVISLFTKPPSTGKKFPPRSIFLVLLLLVVAPFLIEPIRRSTTGDGYPLELQMLFGLRNLGLGLAAFAIWPICLQSACVVSLFLMLFGLCMTTHPAVLWLLGLYCAVGSTWLMLVNWSGLRNSLTAEGSVPVAIESGLTRLPWFASLLVVSVVGCMFAVLAVGPQRTLRLLGEWLPTSGGTDGYDPFARGGLNDGDEETRGNSPKSTGMVETDQFLDSPLPALYDIANDMYGEPFKPKEQERSIALDFRKQKIRESQKPPPDNKRPSREFATSRRGPKEPRSPADRSAPRSLRNSGADADAYPGRGVRLVRRCQLARGFDQCDQLPNRARAGQLLDAGRAIEARADLCRDRIAQDQDCGGNRLTDSDPALSHPV